MLWSFFLFSRKDNTREQIYILGQKNLCHPHCPVFLKIKELNCVSNRVFFKSVASVYVFVAGGGGYIYLPIKTSDLL